MAKNKIAKAEVLQDNPVDNPVKNPVLSILEEVGVTPSEIVDLSVSEREQNLLCRRKEGEAEIEAMQKVTLEAKQRLTEIEKKEKTRIIGKAFRQGKVLRQAMEKTGLQKLSVAEDISVEFTDIATSAAVEIRQGNGEEYHYSRNHVDATFSYPASTKVVRQRKLIKQHQADELAAKKILLALKKDLAGLATHERMARGAIVKAKLAQTAKGKALLLELESIKGGIKALSYSGG